jgi:Fe-S cluster biogenesis protein NfuA
MESRGRNHVYPDRSHAKSCNFEIHPGKAGFAGVNPGIPLGGSGALAQQLFGVSGVSGVFLGQDFITVTKGEGEWQHLKPAILGHIMDHYLSDAPMLMGEKPLNVTEAGEFFDEQDKELVSTIKELLETRVRPAVAQDGGDITFHGFKEGVGYLNMKGSCAGCPSSTATLKHGIENLLRHFVPEVTEVRPM